MLLLPLLLLAAPGADARYAALVCAARSCPPLRSGAWTGERLAEHLKYLPYDWSLNDHRP